MHNSLSGAKTDQDMISDVARGIREKLTLVIRTDRYEFVEVVQQPGQLGGIVSDQGAQDINQHATGLVVQNRTWLFPENVPVVVLVVVLERRVEVFPEKFPCRSPDLEVSTMDEDISQGRELVDSLCRQ